MVGCKDFCLGWGGRIYDVFLLVFSVKGEIKKGTIML